MRHSDALTRGPWRKKWVQYIRALDIEFCLEHSVEENCGKVTEAQLDDLNGALQLAKDATAKILEEVRRALIVGAYGAVETDPEVAPPEPTDLELRYLRSLRESEVELCLELREDLEQTETRPPFEDRATLVLVARQFLEKVRQSGTGR